MTPSALTARVATTGWPAVMLRLAYLGLTNTFAMFRLLRMSDRDKDLEILALRHQIEVLQRQLGDTRARFTPADRALLATLLHRLPRQTLRTLRLLVRPDTVLRWHRELVRRRHAKASRPQRPGRPRTIRSIRLLVLRLAKENYPRPSPSKPKSPVSTSVDANV
jgi:putative transposase